VENWKEAVYDIHKVLPDVKIAISDKGKDDIKKLVLDSFYTDRAESYSRIMNEVHPII